MTTKFNATVLENLNGDYANHEYATAVDGTNPIHVTFKGGQFHWARWDGRNLKKSANTFEEVLALCPKGAKKSLKITDRGNKLWSATSFIGDWFVVGSAQEAKMGRVVEVSFGKIVIDFEGDRIVCDRSPLLAFDNHVVWETEENARIDFEYRKAN